MRFGIEKESLELENIMLSALVRRAFSSHVGLETMASKRHEHLGPTDFQPHCGVVPSRSLCNDAIVSAIIDSLLAHVGRLADCLGLGAGAPAT